MTGGVIALYDASMTSRSLTAPLRSVAAAAVVGGLSLIEPRHLAPWPRAAYRIGVAGASGLLAADTTPEEEALLSPRLDGVLTGAVTLGLMDLGEHLDGRLVDAMRRRGISRPRLVLAAIGAAGTLAVYALEARRSATLVEVGDWYAPDDQERELPAAARDLVGLLLAAPEAGPALPGAPALRAQLPHARTHGPAEEAREVWLTVPETAETAERLERAVPRHQTWPVRGTFTQQGHRFELELQIDDGQLSMLSVFPADVAGDPDLDLVLAEAALEHLSGPDFALPSVAEVEIVRETAAP